MTPQRNLFEIKDIWKYRELLFFLALRDIKVRYKHPAMAIAWTILPAVFLTMVFNFSFGRIVQTWIPSLPYFFFAFIGLIFWNYFTSSLNRASNSLQVNKSLITKVYFPKFIIPLSSIVVSIIDFLFTLLFFLMLSLYFDIPLHITGIFLIIPCIFLALLSALGLGLFFTTLTILYKDVGELLPLLISLLFFLTPVIYPVKTVLEPYHIFLYMNPLTGIIETCRAMLFAPHLFRPEGLFISILSTFLLFLGGFFYFLKHQNEISDIV